MQPEVALLAPMRSELRPLLRELPLEKTRVASREVHRGVVGGTAVLATLTTIGTAAAAATTAWVLDRYPSVRRVVVVGVAGGVGDRVAVGDVVVPELVVDGASGRTFRTDPDAPTGGRAPSGTVWTSDDFIIEPAAVQGLVDQGVVAVDMETAAVAAACEERGRTWVAFRAISDRAEDYEDPWVLDLARPDGSPNLGGVARLLARRPWFAPRLVRLGRDAERATRRAAAAAADALRG